MTVCSQCGSEYERISQHWSMSECDHPNIVNEEIIVGGLMGDATLGKSCKNCRIQYKMINKEYLESLSEKLGFLSTGVKHLMTPEEKAKEDMESEFNISAAAKNYSDVYQLYTICHPKLNKYKQWYDDKKVFPENLVLTPTILKHWYSCDGSIDSGRIEFGISNENSNIEKISNYFKNVDLPEPSNFKNTKRQDGSINTVMRFTVEDSEKLLNYMGEPTRGFEYKWETK